jgi:hypothetical protein
MMVGVRVLAVMVGKGEGGMGELFVGLFFCLDGNMMDVN